MENKYGNFNESQFLEYKKKLHSKVHWLLIYADEKNPVLDSYFSKIQFNFNGLNSLLNYPTQIVEIMNLLESAKVECLKKEYDHELYRGAILDVHDLIDKLG